MGRIVLQGFPASELTSSRRTPPPTRPICRDRRGGRWASASRSRSKCASQSRPRVHRMSQHLCAHCPFDNIRTHGPLTFLCAPCAPRGARCALGTRRTSSSGRPPRTPRPPLSSGHLRPILRAARREERGGRVGKGAEAIPRHGLPAQGAQTLGSLPHNGKR
jgi:hypothetical protein